LKSKRCDAVETIECIVMEQLLAIPKSEFEMCFQHWQEQWNKSFHTEAAYFEGD
jgi:hypothetical protein